MPAEATSLILRVRHEPGTDQQFWIYPRKGEMVHLTEQTMGGMFTLVDVADYEWGPFTNADQQVKIDLTSDPALEPGQTDYFTITAKNCTTSPTGQPARQTILVTGTTGDEPYTPDGGVGSDASTDATPDGGTGDGGTGDGGGNKGCGCHPPGPGTPLPAGLILLGLVPVAWIHRRR